MNRKELRKQIDGLLTYDSVDLTPEEKTFARDKNLIMNCDVPFVVVSTDPPEDIVMKEAIADKLKRKIIYIQPIDDSSQVVRDSESRNNEVLG
jgi:hypothetical protein